MSGGRADRHRLGQAVRSRGGELRGAAEGVGGQYRRRTAGLGDGVHRPDPDLLRRHPGLQQLADIGLPEVYDDPDLASFNSALAQTSATDTTHLIKQAVGVFATDDAATRAFHRITDRTVGCAGQTTAMHLDDFVTQVWTFTGGPAMPADAVWIKQEAGTDRRCFTQTRLRENVLLQAKVCQSGNGGPAVNVLAGAMQNSLGQ